MAERSNAAVSKTVRGGFVPRGFKSLPLRLTGRNPVPAKGLRLDTRIFVASVGNNGRVIDEHDAELLAALAEVRDTLVDDTRPEDDFYPAARAFLELLHAQLVDRGLDVPPLDQWDPRPELLALEGVLAVDRESLAAELPDTVRTIRGSLDAAAAAEMATLN